MRLSFSRPLLAVLTGALLVLGACSADGQVDEPAAVTAVTTQPNSQPESQPDSQPDSRPSSPPAPATTTAPAAEVLPGVTLKRSARWKAVRERMALAAEVEQAARRAAARNPLAGREWGVYRGPADQSWAPYAASAGSNRALLARISERPKAQWFGAWIPDDQIAAKVEDYIVNAQAGDPTTLVQMTVFRMVPWEQEACRRLPTAAEQASYKRWIDSFAAAVGDTPAAIILQPDGPLALCVPGGPGIPSSLIAYSARVFGALENTATYLDAGAADWPAAGQGGVPQVVRFLIPAGVEDVRGIALNSTHYTATQDEIVRGAEIVEALAAQGIPDKKVVISTSSNGRPFTFGDAPGRDPDNATVCSSPTQQACVTLGIPPTTDVANPAWGFTAEVDALARQYVDGFVWFGRPWLYRQNSPFQLDRALALARTTPY